MNQEDFRRKLFEQINNPQPQPQLPVAGAGISKFLGQIPAELSKANPWGGIIEQQAPVRQPAGVMAPQPMMSFNDILPQYDGANPMMQNIQGAGGNVNIPNQQYDRSMAADPSARKTMGKEQDAATKKIKEYMLKKEQMALDIENKTKKLDAQYADQGPDLTWLMRMADQEGNTARMGGNPNFAKTYNQGRMSEAELDSLKSGLQKQGMDIYGGLANDEMKLATQKGLEEKWRNEQAYKTQQLNAKLLAGPKTKALSNEAMKASRLANGAATELDRIIGLMQNGSTVRNGVREWVNPDELSRAMNKYVEDFGRANSGAAISDTEWKNFKEQVANWRDSDEGNIREMMLMRNKLAEGLHAQLTGDTSKMLANSQRMYDPTNPASLLSGAGSTPSTAQPSGLSASEQDELAQINAALGM